MKNHPLLNIISSGSLAGVMAILSIPMLVFRLITLAIILNPDVPQWYRPNNIQLFYSITGLVIVAAYFYMYFSYNNLRHHRILWVLVVILTIAPASYSIFNSSDLGALAIIVHIASTLLILSLDVWGFLIATFHSKQKIETEEYAPVEENDPHFILPRYLRLGLTTQALAIILAIQAILHFIFNLFELVKKEDVYNINHLRILLIPYLSGTIIFILAYAVIFFNRKNARIQRWAWLLAVCSGVIFFFPVIESFKHIQLHSFHDLLTPLVILFLTIRGYCLVRVEEALRNRHTVEIPDPVYYKYHKPFYAVLPPAGLTSSRLALAALCLWIFGAYTVFGYLVKSLDRYHPQYLLAMLAVFPFYLLILSYMYMYNSPSKPQSHTAWWWYSLAINGLIGIFGCISLFTGGREYVIIFILVASAFISIKGLVKAEIDDPYELRLR